MPVPDPAFQGAAELSCGCLTVMEESGQVLTAAKAEAAGVTEVSNLVYNPVTEDLLLWCESCGQLREVRRYFPLCFPVMNDKFAAGRPLEKWLPHSTGLMELVSVRECVCSYFYVQCRNISHNLITGVSACQCAATSNLGSILLSRGLQFRRGIRQLLLPYSTML